MTTAAHLIVLSHTKFGENALVLHTLSREFGRRSFLVRLGKGGPSSMFLPLSILDVEITENPRSDLWTARRFSTAYPLLGIRSSLYKNTMTMFLSEVLYRSVTEGAYEEGLFDWCEKEILLLDALEDDYSNFHVSFLLGLAVALGFRPEPEDLSHFAGTYYQRLTQFLQLPFSETMLIPLTGKDRSELCRIMLKYIEFHLGITLNVRSLDVLRELYQ